MSTTAVKNGAVSRAASLGKKPAPIQHEGASLAVVTITPATAATMLASRNGHNRKLNEKRVEHLAAEMTSGHWDFNGDACRFGADGLVLDGQHRLAACVKSGVPFTTVVISGLATSTQGSMDIGRKRTVADTLAIANEKHATILATSLGFLNRWLYDGRMTNTSRSVPLTPKGAVETLAEHPGLREHVNAFSGYRAVRVLGSPGGFSAFAYVITQADRQDAAEFIDGVLVGASLNQNDPRYVVREALMRKYGRYGALSPTGRLHLLMQAWLAFQRREERVAFRVPSNLYSAKSWPDLPGDTMRFAKAVQA